MTDAARDLVVTILRQAAAAAPEPWHPDAFARSTGTPREHVAFCVGLLRDEGVLRPPDAGRDGEVVLTPEGEALARDARSLEYFCAEQDAALPGEEPDGNPQRRAVAAVLRSPARRGLNRLLIWANLLVFAFGLYLASRRNVAGEFFQPIRIVRQANGAQLALAQNRGVEDVLVRTGLLQREDFVRGRWWRLLTACFVHVGVLHLAMNLLALRVVGADVEWMWGSGRYLVLYLLAGLGGSCAALTTAPAVAGASGALCGLIAAEAVWLVLNRRYLPRRLVRGQLGNLALTALLIGAISLASVVSGAGHLGGAVVGGVAAVLLHYLRFGGVVARAVALVALVAMPVACLMGLRHVSERDPDWPAVRARPQNNLAITTHELHKIDDALQEFEESHLVGLLLQHPDRRDEAKVRQARAALPGHIDRCRDAVERLRDMGPLPAEQSEAQRQAALRFFGQMTGLLELARQHLEENRKWRTHPEWFERVAEIREPWRPKGAPMAK